MSTVIHNHSKIANPIPGPVFRWSRDKEGKCTGSHTFTCVKGAMEMPANQARFKKGTPVTELDPSIGAMLSFLTLLDFDVQTISGGYEEVSCSFEGFGGDSGDFETDREVSYSSNNTLVEKSILQHPRYLQEVTATDSRDSFSKLYNGLATATPTMSGGSISNIAFYDMLGNMLGSPITDENTLKWYRLIFVEDNRTFQSPTFEWVKSTTNAGGLTGAELTKLGKIDSSPPGGPPEPPAEEGYTWMKTGANDVRGESSASTEETWTWGHYPAEIYDAA